MQVGAVQLGTRARREWTIDISPRTSRWDRRNLHKGLAPECMRTSGFYSTDKGSLADLRRSTSRYYIPPVHQAILISTQGGRRPWRQGAVLRLVGISYS
jgi:hypothetical protein